MIEAELTRWQALGRHLDRVHEERLARIAAGGPSDSPYVSGLKAWWLSRRFTDA